MDQRIEGGENMKKILWVSNHPPLPAQLTELRSLYGDDVEIIEDTTKYKKAEDILLRYRKSEATDLHVVAPLSRLHHLCAKGIHPLYSVMVEMPNSDGADLKKKETWWKFDGFYRLIKLELRLKPVKEDTLGPDGQGSRLVSK